MMSGHDAILRPCPLLSPKADIVGAGEHAKRNCQAQRLSGLEVDHQHERGRLDKWQIGRAKLGPYHGGLLLAFAWGYR